MPNLHAAKKALRVSQKRHSRNRHFIELYKESLKAFETAIKENKTGEFAGTLSKLFSRVDTLAKKQIIHDNTAARRKSRFSRMISGTK